MELYSLIGGLSFASLLATTLIILTRRNGTLFRSHNGNENIFRNVDHHQSVLLEDPSNEIRLKVPQAFMKMKRLLQLKPWWTKYESQRSIIDSRNPMRNKIKRFSGIS
jgi:hypothetical protein